MSRDGNEKVWQALCATMALCLAMIGWYTSKISSDLSKANDGIMSLAVQVARLEARMDGIERRLDTGIVGVEPSKFDSLADNR